MTVRKKSIQVNFHHTRLIQAIPGRWIVVGRRGRRYMGVRSVRLITTQPHDWNDEWERERDQFFEADHNYGWGRDS